MVRKFVRIFQANVNFILLIKIFSTFDITLSTHHISKVPWKLSFKQKHRHTDLPKTNQKEKLYYNVCVCHVSLTVMSIALNIAIGKRIRIDYYPLGIARRENFLTFSKTIENLFSSRKGMHANVSHVR